MPSIQNTTSTATVPRANPCAREISIPSTRPTRMSASCGLYSLLMRGAPQRLKVSDRSDLDYDRQHHRAAFGAVVQILAEQVLDLLLEQRRLELVALHQCHGLDHLVLRSLDQRVGAADVDEAAGDDI